jgi:hypothetical protein
VTVRNIREAAETCHQYKSVLTAGPRYHEVSDFRHPDHKIVEFADSINADFGPSFEHVEEMVKWGETRDSILVHCHAGISRSTATAWGISIAQGVNPVVALDALVENHPQNYHPYVPEYSGGGYPYQREFSPNPQLVRHLEVLFGYDKDHLIGLLYDKGIHVRQSL